MSQETLARQSIAMMVEEEGSLVVSTGQLRPATFQIPGEDVVGVESEIDLSLFRSFPHATDRGGGRVDVIEVQRGQFGDSHPGVPEQVEHGAVAEPARRIRTRL